MSYSIRIRVRLLICLFSLTVILVPQSARAERRIESLSASLCRSTARTALATQANAAGLVIDFGDKRVLTFCVDLGSDGQATGEEVLRATGLPIVIEYTGGVGGAMCAIDGIGSKFPTEPCFAQCTLKPNEPCRYWSYSQLVGDRWNYSQTGASNTIIRAGDVEGWAWGEGTIAKGAQPPLRTLAEICAANTVLPTATATATATLPPVYIEPPSATPQPSAVPTQVPPSATPLPSATPPPSVVPTRLQPSATPLPALTQTPVATEPPPALPTAVPPAPPAPTAPPATEVAPIATIAPLVPTTPPSATIIVPSEAPLPTSAPTASRTRPSAGATTLWLPVVASAVVQQREQIPVPPLAPNASATPSVASTRGSAVATGATPEADATATYPYFVAMMLMLIGCWATLRRGRRSQIQ